MTETVLQTQHVLPMWKRQAYIWSIMVLGCMPCGFLFLLNSLLTVLVLSKFDLLSSEDWGLMMLCVAGFFGVFAAFNAICCIIAEKPLSRRIVVFGFLGVLAAVCLIVLALTSYARDTISHTGKLFLGIYAAPTVAYIIALHYNYTFKKYAKANTLENRKELLDPAG
jgi:hypothetical protein